MSPEQQKSITPGPDGTPVPPGTSVIRLEKLPAPNGDADSLLQQGKAWPGLFILSSADKKRRPPRLSVWLTALTSVAQAWARRPVSRVVCTLGVDAMREVAAEAEAHRSTTRSLDVEWEKAVRVVDGLEVPDELPGHEGHCGITGLGDDNGNKTQRELLRSILADTVRPGDVTILTDADIVSFQAAATSA